MRDLAGRAVGTGRRKRPVLWAGVLLALVAPLATSVLALAADDFDDAPIGYATARPADPIARLQERIDRGEVTLKRDARRGYLQSLLQTLSISGSSQTLVFSKTSFQRDLISPLTPRALYFNDETYVGWVQGGQMLEIASVDPTLGTVFYTLSQHETEKPKFVRQTDECLSCHSSTLTKGVPGLTMRSVFAGRDGLPILPAGTFITTDESPMKERWGGWYVTGTHGAQHHMGNLTARDASAADTMDRSAGANVTDLRRYFDTSAYLNRHSDIVALMVSEHQTHVQNLLIKAGYETRKALHYEQMMNRELGRPADYRSESTLSRIKSVGEPLVRALLLTSETPLTEPVAGTSGFAAHFEARGPHDRQNRSLRALDLKSRLFRYPCSYLIYSPSFDALPEPAKEYVYRRLHEVLSGKDASPAFARLSPEDRKAVMEILTETKPEFAARAPKA